MARVLFLSLVFPPDSVSTAQIMGDLAVDLKGLGNTVMVLTTLPHYNRDPDAEARQPIRWHWGPLLQKSDYNGIPVYHTWIPKKGKSILLRPLAWICFHLISTVAGLTVISKPDVIIAPSPPLTIGFCAWLLSVFYRASYIYNVQEIYPDILINAGTLRHHGLIKVLFRMEQFVYGKAGAITVIAPRMRQRLLDKQVPADKVQVIPNFVDVREFHPLPKDNAFSRAHNVHAKFVVTYAGNMGVAQGLDTFIEAAKHLETELEIHFMLMGDGVLKDTLRQRVVERGLRNFSFLPYQPYASMPQIYAASDVCLVSQSAETGCDAIPSKVYRIMACARAVLAVTDPTSDLASLVTGTRCGAVVPPNSSRQLADAILGAYRDQAMWQQMGQAGRDHVIEKYTRSAIADQYDRLVRSLIASKSPIDPNG